MNEPSASAIESAPDNPASMWPGESDKGVIPPAPYPWTDAGAAAVALLVFWFISQTWVAALAYAMTIGLIVYLVRQAVLIHRMWSDLRVFPWDETAWPARALQQAVISERINRRTDAAEILERVQRKRLELASAMALRWWWCAMAAFAIPLLGLLSGWIRVHQVGDLWPRNMVFHPLTLAWTGGVLVVFLDCILYYLGERMWIDWEQAIRPHASPNSDLMQTICKSALPELGTSFPLSHGPSQASSEPANETRDTSVSPVAIGEIMGLFAEHK